MFSPYLIGFNTGQNLVLSGKEGIGLNAAVSGQEANHAPDQTRKLVQRLKENNKIDFKNDWKLITVFVGSNDLCDFCKDKVLHSPTSFVKFLTAALDILYDQVPRAFVNLVSVINISEGQYIYIYLSFLYMIRLLILYLIYFFSATFKPWIYLQHFT
jgi:phospholipase B1, membrane-associated